MSVNNNFRNSVPSLVQPLSTLFPAPVVAKRVPTANDINYPLGQVWIFPAGNEAFFLTSVVAGAATWESVTGGAGVFTSLTVNPGPTNLSTVGNGNVNIGNAANTGAITINTGTGNFLLNGNGNQVNLGADAAANNVFLGTRTNGALTTISGGNTAGDAILLQTAAAGGIQIGLAGMTGTISLGVSTAGQTVNILNTANAANTVNILAAGATGGGTLNIATGAAAITSVIGNNTAGSTIALNSPVVTLRGPVQLLTGAGAPGNGLAVNVGDLYINTTAATAATRIYVATGAGAWTNVTCAA